MNERSLLPKCQNHQLSKEVSRQVTAFFVDRAAHSQIPHLDQVLSATPPAAIRSLRRFLDEKHMGALSLRFVQQDGVVPAT